MRPLDADFEIVQGDEAPAILATFEDDAGNPVPFNPGDAVAFTMRSARTGAAITPAGAASIVSPSAASMKYQWAAADTATPGDYACRFRVTYADTTKESVPAGPEILVRVNPR